MEADCGRRGVGLQRVAVARHHEAGSQQFAARAPLWRDPHPPAMAAHGRSLLRVSDVTGAAFELAIGRTNDL